MSYAPQRRAVFFDSRYNERDIDRTLYLAVRYAYEAGVPGDVIEFGTMTGNTAESLASGIAQFDGLAGRGNKTLWLLDSFEGLPSSPAPEDSGPQNRAGMWQGGTCIDLDATRLRQRIARVIPEEKIKIVSGWFRETVAAIEGTTFSCIHVDCDLYQSTLDALEPLFARQMVERGAVILFDDWNFNRASDEYGERAAWIHLSCKYGIHITSEGSYGAMGYRFIIQSYY